MPTLLQLLQSQDLGHLRLVAELWGLEQTPRDLEAGAEAAAAAMQDARLAAEVIEALEAPARAALDELKNAGGRIPWVTFVRQHGDVREMGAGRRDRERPHLHPVSPAEVLYYRALLGRAFLETDKGPQEFAYVPDDLLRIIQTGSRSWTSATAPLGRAATPAERNYVQTADDNILDDATTLLAALRINEAVAKDAVLTGLLEAAGILQRGVPQAGKVKAFLEMTRADALRMLVDAWRNSDTFNELRLLPGLICEGTWTNQPRAARKFILEQVAAVPGQAWWSLPAFVNDMKIRHADFQRPAGDYDSWFIKSATDGSYLRGFESWNEVEGALIRFLITVVMHRLGLSDIASPAKDQGPSAFRRREAGPARSSTIETGKVHVLSQGRITATRQVQRSVRYQLARFCEWDAQGPDEFRYHISPRSLERATKQGLKVEQLLVLLAKHGDAGIPAPVVKALKRWETAGTEARTESQVVLRVTRPEILKELRRSKAAKYLGEPLGPTSVIVKGGAMHKVAEAMVELGLLVEDRTEASK
ncbi:MAG TPA: helicase-associated domain-containing protein [Anaerolineales bacterium]